MVVVMETLYEGPLDRCFVSAAANDAKKEWKKGYCVFRKHNKNGSKLLEFYKDSHWSKSEPKAVCNLFSDYTVHISVSQSKKRFTFELKNGEHSYELSAQTQVLRQKWMDELTKEAPSSAPEQKFTIIKSFNVVLLSEEHRKRFLNSASGSCQLVVTDAEVILKVNGHHRVLWKFATIRRYKSQTGTFVLEVGRKAPTGEGEFSFETNNPAELFDVLDKAVKDRMKAKGIEISHVPSQEHSKAPSTSNFPIKSAVGKIDRSLHGPPPLPSTPMPNIPPSLPGISHFPPKSPTTESEYSHLGGNTQTKSPVKTNPDYDMLFNRERLIQQRASEPNILNGQVYPPPRPTTNRLTPNNSIDVPNDEDEYEQMSGSVADSKNFKDYLVAAHKDSPKTIQRSSERKPRPLPAPRVKPSIRGSSPKLDLRKSNSSPLIQESTYDQPTASVKKELNSRSDTPTDYDTLFKSNNNNTTVVSEYSHLAHNGVETNKHLKNETVSEDSYDIPKVLPKPTPGSPGRKTVLKPSRPAPLPPGPKNTVVKNGRPGLSVSAGVKNDLILQLQKRNKEITNNAQQAREDLYDSPGAPPIGYNQVGELIPGEYHRSSGAGNTNSMDSDGYVRVPESDQIEDIYQVPRD